MLGVIFYFGRNGVGQMSGYYALRILSVGTELNLNYKFLTFRKACNNFGGKYYITSVLNSVHQLKLL